MFHFIKFDGASESYAYDKGLLFERLCRRIVKALGYDVSEFREKVAGAEYDISAHSLLQSSKKLIGEAKALSRSIDITIIKAFVGSLDVYEPDTVGLFLSLSDLTPDAREFMRRLQPPKRDHVESIVGAEVIQRLSSYLQYMSPSQIQQRAHAEFGMCSGDTNLLVSDRGDFYIQWLIQPEETRPSAFAVYRPEGDLIRDPDLAVRLRQHLPHLQELRYMPEDQPSRHSWPIASPPIGPTEGAGWFDYFLPAPPTHFIGRRQELQAYGKFLGQVRSKKSNIRVFQVLSRSGVGKSSLLLKLRSDVDLSGPSVIEDARNIKSSIDLSSVVRAFVTHAHEFLGLAKGVPADTQGLIHSVRDIDSLLLQGDLVAAFYIDQFEALFLQPDLYAQTLNIILEITQSTSRIVFCLARKTDQPTTFDERAEVDLSHLMQISASVRLDDFTRSEAMQLVSHIPEEIAEPLQDELRDMILEFSYGFPWLCKRICAHVIGQVISGTSQADLIQSGLKPGDLFEEDLNRLNDVDRDYLTQLVHYLPAAVQELSEVFPPSVLIKKLDLFQKERLIRLTGRSYDTYNDVLKEYLKSGDVPNVKHVFRTASRATFGLLLRIIENNWTSVDEMADAQRTSRGVIFNKLRELKLMGLVSSTKGSVSVSPEALEAYRRDNLASLIRSRARKNGLVCDILDELTIKGELSIDELTEVMKRKMLMLDVSPDTWVQYARVMSAWLRNLRFVVLARDVLIPLKEAIYLGNSDLTLRPTSMPAGCFLPSSYMRRFVAVLEGIGQMPRLDGGLGQQTSSGRNEEINDGIRAGFLERAPDGSLLLTAEGDSFVRLQEKREFLLRRVLLQYDNVLRYLDEVRDTWMDHTEAMRRSLAAAIGVEVDYTEQTWEWRSKLMANWLEFAGLVVRRDGMVQRCRQTSFWD